jgi:hypothetical protein
MCASETNNHPPLSGTRVMSFVFQIRGHPKRCTGPNIVLRHPVLVLGGCNSEDANKNVCVYQRSHVSWQRKTKGINQNVHDVSYRGKGSSKTSTKRACVAKNPRRTHVWPKSEPRLPAGAGPTARLRGSVSLHVGVGVASMASSAGGALWRGISVRLSITERRAPGQKTPWEAHGA